MNKTNNSTNNNNSFLPKLSILIPNNEQSTPTSVSANRYKKSPVREANIHDKIIDLALFTLNLTKEDYISIKAEDFSNIYTLNTHDKILAIEILEYYKRNDIK